MIQNRGRKVWDPAIWDLDHCGTTIMDGRGLIALELRVDGGTLVLGSRGTRP